MAADYGDALLKEYNPYAALTRAMLPLLGTLVFALLWSLSASLQLESLLAAAAATALCLPPLALGVSYGEDAIIRGNRLREKTLRLFTFAGHLAEPRWSVSLTGAGVVLVVLAGFRSPANRLCWIGWLRRLPVCCYLRSPVMLTPRWQPVLLPPWCSCSAEASAAHCSCFFCSRSAWAGRLPPIASGAKQPRWRPAAPSKTRAAPFCSQVWRRSSRHCRAAGSMPGCMPVLA